MHDYLLAVRLFKLSIGIKMSVLGFYDTYVSAYVRFPDIRSLLRFGLM